SAFFYGSLMHPKVLTRVLSKNDLPGPDEGVPAVLMGYRRHPIMHAAYPACVPGRDKDTVQGLFVQGLTEEHICLLDYFEGNEYTRERVLVVIGNEADGTATTVEADTYIWCGNNDLLLTDRDWDWVYFKEHNIGRFMTED
ncbi:hypothetical protein BDF19DRAFT_334751, partial [Syncephalis fuscata]